MAASSIELRGVDKAYGSGPKVLRGVDLAIAPGEFVALMGRSGCGKTTLLNVIGALDGDFHGHAQVMGHELGSMSDGELSRFRNLNVGFIFQAFHLLEHLNCRENVALPALFDDENPLSFEARRARADALLEQVGLAGLGPRQPNALSGGERQRVAIARALFNRPSLLIADEPTGNLDVETGEAVMQMFRQLQRDEGLTMVMVTHDANVAERADRVVVMQDGQIVEARAA